MTLTDAQKDALITAICAAGHAWITKWGDPMSSNVDFEYGFDFGRMAANIAAEGYDYDIARIEVLDALIDHMKADPDHLLVQILVDTWYSALCHGRLEPGGFCSTCGTSRSEDT